MGTDMIKIPYAINKDGTQLLSDFNKHNFVMWIAGRPGSGKSTVLKSMILYLIQNSSSSDIELWLVDIKGVNFNKFESMNIPHITKIFNYDGKNRYDECFDRILKEIENRKTLFAENGGTKFEEAKSSKKFHTLFVIIDEFEMLINSSKDKQHENIMKFRNIIIQAAAFGIKLVFSTSSSVGSLNILPVMIQSQINQRLALTPMDSSELKEFLKLSGEDTRVKDIESLPDKYAILSRIAENEVSFGQSIYMDY